MSWWPAENNAQDAHGFHDGVLIGGTTNVPGFVGQAFSFNGVDSQVQIGPAQGLEMVSTLSIETWIFPTGPGSHSLAGGIIVNKEGEYEIARWADGTIRWAFANTNPGWNWISSAYVAPLNQWTHVAVTYDNGVVKTYANGAVVHTFNGSGTIGDVLPAFDDFRIGGRQEQAHFFAGLIDEVSVYGGVLTASEIQDIYNAGSAGKCVPPPPPPPCIPDLVSWWPGEGSAVDVEDGNDGTLQNGATFTSGMVGQAFSFDGADDFVQIGAAQNLKRVVTLSVEAWIFPTGPGSHSPAGGIIVNKEGEYEIARWADGTIRWSFANTSPGWNWISTGYVAPLNQWTHVAVTYENGAVRTYANGALVHTFNGLGSIGDVLPTLNDFRIGGRQEQPHYFQGHLDEVSVYRRALSAAEIADIFDAGSAGKCPDDTTPPVVFPPPDLLRLTGPTSTSCHVFVSDSELGVATATDDISVAVTIERTGVPAGNLFPVGITAVTYTATDEAGNSSSAPQLVTVTDDTSPTMELPADITVFTDPGACTAVVEYAPLAADNCDVLVTCSPASGTAFPVGSTTVECTATDPTGNMTSASFMVTVQNPAPDVTITGPASGAIFSVDTPVTFTASISDAAGDEHTAQWAFDDVPTGTASIVDGIVTLVHPFPDAGVYKVSLSVEDLCNDPVVVDQVDDLEALVVVYDPQAGFVTGGGWIDSPAGAYTPDATLTGKANFGFVSRYKNGASIPTGKTRFRFRVADLDFESSSYDWLVIAGARAQYKGWGAINSAGSYRFMLTAIDGERPGGGGVDRLRMKIWNPSDDTIVYDNQIGADDGDDPTTTLGGGSIRIQQDGASKPAVGAATTLPTRYALRQNFPDPFNPSTTIAFDLPDPAVVSLHVYDVRGRHVATLASKRAFGAGRHELHFDGNGLSSGVYFYALNSPHYSDTKRMLLIK